MAEYRYPGYAPTREGWLTARPGTVGGYHGGTDNPAAPGTPVYAQYGGEVIRSGNIKGYGMAVVVESTAPNGTVFRQLYGHLGPGPLPPPGTPVTADQPIPGAVIGTKEYVQSQGGITSGPHLHREIISGEAELKKNPKEGFGIYSSDITYKADPDGFDINNPVFPYQRGEPKPTPLQPRSGNTSRPLTSSLPRTTSRQAPRDGELPTLLAPGTAIPGAEGPTSIGGPSGPSLLVSPRSRMQAPASPAPARDAAPRLLQFAPETVPQSAPVEGPGPFGRDAFGAASLAPAWLGTDRPTVPAPESGRRDPFASALSPVVFGSGVQSLSAPFSRAGLSFGSPPAISGAPASTDMPGGLPGLLMQADVIDPSNPDAPPAGGLLGLLQGYFGSDQRRRD